MGVSVSVSASGCVYQCVNQWVCRSAGVSVSMSVCGCVYQCAVGGCVCS